MIYRTEHPNPQFERKNWRCLNGVWDFEFDQGVSGEARGLHRPDSEYSLKINVPFCPESALSGIGNTDFINSVWYKRTVDISKDDLKGRVLLRFGAVDYEATVFVNGNEAFSHRGGYVGFSGDITDFLTEGENVITVRAIDDTRDRMIPSGKQCRWYRSSGCSYTRTTGIWQSVWLEFVPAARIIRTIKTVPTVKTIKTSHRHLTRPLHHMIRYISMPLQVRSATWTEIMRESYPAPSKRRQDPM